MKIPQSIRKQAMDWFDSLSPEWRDLIRDFGPDAEEAYWDNVPTDSTQRARTPAEIRRDLSR